MSGIGEASLVLGLISSVITIFEAAQEIYEAASDTQGLPKKFRMAAEQIPLVYHALSLAEQNIRAEKVDRQALQSAIPVLERCKETAARVKVIFEKTIPRPEASRTERLKQAVGLKKNSKKVQEDMEAVVKGMELLAHHRVFQDAATLEDIKAAVEQLGNLPDEEGPPQFVHSGAGAINAITGPGQQQNYNNSGSGHQYNAEKQIFGRDKVDHQTNVILHYYSREDDRMSLAHNLDHRVNLPYSPTASEKGFLATIGPHHFMDIQERVVGTCVWSIETVQYHLWAQSSQSSILWITGGAGTGKTTLANYLIEHIKEETGIYHNGLGLCSFFCSRDTEGLHDVASVLQGLVLQLVEHNAGILRQIKSIYGMTKQDHSRSFETVWRMFENVIDLLPSHCIYIMIDALDECDGQLPSRLFQKLAKLLGSIASSSRANLKRIKLIISGQPWIRAAWGSEESSIDHYYIDIEDSVAQDIMLFVDDKMSELIRENFFSETVGQDLRRAISSGSEISFLWLTVVFQHIKTSLHYRQAHLEDILARVSQKLQPTYARYVPRVDNDQISLLQCYLRLFVASSRPLKFAEIDILTLLQDEKLSSSSSITAENGEVVKASIQRALGPLVRFSYGTARLIHSTVKDFFVLLARQPFHHLHTTHGTDPIQAHLFCFRSCMAYLLHGSIPRDLFDAVTRNSPSIQVDSPISDQQYQDRDAKDITTDFIGLEEVHFLRDEEFVENEACIEIQERLQAYDYAATNWAYHLAHCEALADDNDVGRAIDLLSPTTGHLKDWYRYSSQQSQLRGPSLSESSPIVLAAMFGLTKAMNVLYHASECRLSLQDLSSALYWAASRGSVSAVKLLLDYGATTSSEQCQRLPLMVAVQGNFLQVCKHLLANADVDPNQIDICGKPALVLAAEANHVDILHLLLSHPSIDVDHADLDKQTALIAACRSGSTEAVRTLREDGRADVNTVDVKGQSPLYHASKTGNLATVKELIKFSAMDNGMVDKNGRNAISIAAQEGHLDMVRALHKMKIDAASVDRNGRNALSWAANSLRATEPANDKSESVLEYLVKKYPNDVNVPDESGWTPLAWALDTPGYVRSVLMLTQSPSVDVNHRDEVNGKCILAWAASAGMTDIVRCLLRRSDLEVDCPSFNGQTALAYAAANGMIETVKVLLEVGNASAHRLDHAGRTPADWAEISGFMEIAILLRGIPERAV